MSGLESISILIEENMHQKTLVPLVNAILYQLVKSCVNMALQLIRQKSACRELYKKSGWLEKMTSDMHVSVNKPREGGFLSVH